LKRKSLDNHTITQHHNISEEDRSDIEVITDRNQKRGRKSNPRQQKNAVIFPTPTIALLWKR
jgi:hypothetical protein